MSGLGPEPTVREYKKKVIAREIIAILIILLLSGVAFWYAREVIKTKDAKIGELTTENSRLEGLCKSKEDNAPAPSCEAKPAEVVAPPVVAPLVTEKEPSKCEEELKIKKKELKFCENKRKALWKTLEEERRKNLSKKSEPEKSTGGETYKLTGVRKPKEICELTSDGTARLKINPTVKLEPAIIIAREEVEPRLDHENCDQWRERMAKKHVVGY